MSESASRIVVTGASGFIGRHLVSSLAKSGAQVIGVTRGVQLEIAGARTAFVSDVLDRESIREALRGATSVVHLAARVHARPEGRTDAGSECRRINVDGTSLLLDESAAAGVRTFVFASSVKAVAGESDEMLTTDTAPQPIDAYGESKLEAERLVRVVARREGMHAPILRLPNVYGPGMKANMAFFFGAIDKGMPLPLASVRNRRSFAYVANAVEAIEALVSSSPGVEDTFYVSDEHDLSTPQLVRHIARALGRPARLIPAPAGILRGMGIAGGLLSRIARLHFSTESVSALLGSLFVDTSSLRRMTGFRPPVSVENGMSATAEWFRARHSHRD